ncbi:hypothetical protein [Brevundimonas sp.]|uniref:hypothetical protein n=2 Tax=Brevundimonas sp. TaxID=1871086 RepID=UPI0027F25332|nr:hypothetical protein [Brevundimonas sp.]MDQ7811491.1 hypothetical protein [Brevundimonas sp.]
MTSWAFIAAMLSTFASPQDALPQSPPPPQDPPEATATLEDVVVEGRALEEMVREFVGEVGAPAGRRGLARWHDRLCVGVVNVRPDLGQAVADRVSQVALDLGLDIGEPGCRANVFIVFTADGAALADAMVEESRRAFRIGVAGLDRGSAALEAFRTVDRPVRWWQISLPVNADTGQRAVRLSGDEAPPQINVFAASRLSTQIRDDLKKAMIIVDVDRLGQVNLAQLADYLAFVTLVQVDPEAETAAYDTILNLFDAPGGVDGLTGWDVSYLTSLYEVQGSPVLRQNPRGQASVIAADMVRDRRDVDPPTSEGEPSDEE